VAARHVLVRRGLEGGSSESSGVLENIWWFRLATFVLGALPQVIKLYGMAGIPWTQAWASMYLVAFLLIEILTQLGGTGWTQGQLEFTDQILRIEKNFDTLEVTLGHVGFAVQAVIWGLICATLIPTDMLYTINSKYYSESYNMEWLFWPLAIPSILFSFFLSVGIYGVWLIIFLGPVLFGWFVVRMLCDIYTPGVIKFISALLAITDESASLVLCLAICIPLLYGSYSVCYHLSNFKSISGVMEWAMTWIVELYLKPGPSATYFMKFELGVFFLGCVSLVIILLYRIFFVGSYSSPFKSKFEVSGTWKGCYSFQFFLFTLVTAFMYYCYRFSSTGTFKPEWAEVLG